jgi:iron complex transport system substrate-binding protein
MGWRCALALAALLAAGCGAPTPGPAPAPSFSTRPVRIASLDYCADQFVLKLADAQQIAAVSPDAERDFSFMRTAAAGVRKVRPTAEDVLALRPDLVVRSYGGGPNAAALLARAGVPMAQLEFAGDFEGVRANIRAMAQAFGHPERGEALVAEMNARLEAAQGPPSGREEPTALYMTPAGVTTGEGSLVHVLLRAANLANFQDQPGWSPIPLERLARTQPDLIAASFFGSQAAPPQAWSAARHPVAQRQLAQRPSVALEGAWTACGGWFLVEAVEALARGRAAALEAAP